MASSAVTVSLIPAGCPNVPTFYPPERGRASGKGAAGSAVNCEHVLVWVAFEFRRNSTGAACVGSQIPMSRNTAAAPCRDWLIGQYLGVVLAAIPRLKKCHVIPWLHFDG